MRDLLVLLAVTMPAAGAEPATPGAPLAVHGVEAALGAEPADCDVLRSAFAQLAQQGRQEGDVAAIVAGRRGPACAKEAADAAAKALRIPASEVLAWVLRHPAPMAEPDASTPRLEEGTPGLDCGLTLVARRHARRDGAWQLLLTFRNDTGSALTGYTLAADVGGQPWKVEAGESVRHATPGDPMGAGSLRWDDSTGGWEDEREREARSLRLRRTDPVEGFQPVLPASTFDVPVGLAAPPAPGADAERVPITFTACRLDLRPASSVARPEADGERAP